MHNLLPLQRFHLLPWKVDGKTHATPQRCGSKTREPGTQDVQPRSQMRCYPFGRPLCDEATTQGSEGDKFSAAHCRAKRLSSAAVYKLSLCLIFSQCVSIVLRLRWNCSAISRGLYAA